MSVAEVDGRSAQDADVTDRKEIAMNHMGRVVVVFSVATLATASVGFASEASAFTQYTSEAAAGRCSVLSGSSGTVDWLAGELENSGAASTVLLIACAVTDSTALPMAQMNHVSVDTYNQAQPGFAPSASACIQDNLDEAVTCGVPAIGSKTFGHQALAPTTSLWTSPPVTGYPFVSVNLPGTQSGLMGIGLSN